ncbi:hypothetical protein AVEN_224066-1 [Araneus ventricosus]|uniref:Uncharacterized protein n=1 Tax=Araneus ventricosus TaxID=182803 RepID=A0A4Y2WC42_ARAVE|nr:hypothetical protein AVEN_224066-1 [Araneus ventricosus]
MEWRNVTGVPCALMLGTFAEEAYSSSMVTNSMEENILRFAEGTPVIAQRLGFRRNLDKPNCWVCPDSSLLGFRQQTVCIHTMCITLKHWSPKIVNNGRNLLFGFYNRLQHISILPPQCSS